MGDGGDLEREVRELLRARAPQGGDGELSDELRLGGGGLGLDSIALVELLLDCERRFGAPAAALLDGPPLTVGGLVAHLRAASRR